MGNSQSVKKWKPCPCRSRANEPFRLLIIEQNDVCDPANDKESAGETLRIASYLKQRQHSLGLVSIYTSQFYRSVETAAAIALKFNMKAQVEWRFYKKGQGCNEAFPDVMSGKALSDKLDPRVIALDDDLKAAGRNMGIKQEGSAGCGNSVIVVMNRDARDVCVSNLCSMHAVGEWSPCVPSDVSCSLTEVINFGHGWRVVSDRAKPWNSYESMMNKNA